VYIGAQQNFSRHRRDSGFNGRMPFLVAC
jgi:hypothetical protein